MAGGGGVGVDGTGVRCYLLWYVLCEFCAVFYFVFGLGVGEGLTVFFVVLSCLPCAIDIIVAVAGTVDLTCMVDL